MCAHIVFLFFLSAFLLSFFPFDFSATKWFVEHMSCLLYAIASDTCMQLMCTFQRFNRNGQKPCLFFSSCTSHFFLSFFLFLSNFNLNKFIFLEWIASNRHYACWQKINYDRKEENSFWMQSFVQSKLFIAAGAKSECKGCAHGLLKNRKHCTLKWTTCQITSQP